MGPTGEFFKALQVHPTRFCNLTCRHCYSSSGPDQHEELPVGLLLSALDDAHAEGYNDVAFSGGEPILYDDLRALLGHAKSLGMATNLTSNGILLKGKRLKMIEGVTDLLAISLDGVPDSHNRMRNHPKAFDLMFANLEGIRETGIPFGFIFTLTMTNLHELRWVVDFAVEHGAALLQIHPLEEVGRGEQLRGSRPDDVESAFAYLQSLKFQAEAGGKIAIRIDLIDRELVREASDRVYACDCGRNPEEIPLAEHLSPLVIEQDGAVVPLQYGFSRRYQVGNLHEVPLRDAAARWKSQVSADFRALCKRVFDTEMGKEELPIFNWYESVTEASHHRPEERLPVMA